MQSSKATDFAQSRAHRSVRATARQLDALVVGYFSKNQDNLLRQRLLELSNSKGPHPDVQIRAWQNARYFFDKDAGAFNASFVATLETSLNDEVQTLAHERARRLGPATSPAELSDELNLSLLGVAEMERMLLHDEVVQRFNTHYEATLTPLTLRLRTLFGREIANLQCNPYRPEVLLRAFMLALKNCSFEEDATHSVLLAFDPQHCIDLAPLYIELDQTLAQAGVAAQSHRVRKSSGGTSSGTSARPAGVAGAGMGDASGFSAYSPTSGYGYGYGAPGWPVTSHAREFLRAQAAAYAPPGVLVPADMVPGSSRWGAWTGGTPVAADALVPINPYLLSYLEELRARAIESFAYRELDIDLGSPNLLRDMREDEEILDAQEFYRGTVDALAEVFDFVFLDPDIAAPLKVVLGRLQIPVLKAALLDRNFFFSPNHPARRLIDALAAAAVAWTPEKGFEDPLYLQIEAAVKRVLTEFDQDLALFGEVLLEFEEFAAEEEERAKQQVQQLARLQETEETLEAARTQVDPLIHERIIALPEERNRTAFLLPFLTQQWREVLARAYVNHLSQPDQWTNFLNTTDQLLWSIQHKRNSAERRQLVTVLPGLVRQLNASLDTLEWDAAERETFTRRLIATHMNAIRSRTDADQHAAPDSTDQRASDEALWTLNQRIAADQATEPDSFDAMVRGFERGMWFDFLSDEGLTHRCRLTWVSPKRGRFLFTNREGFDAFVRSEREVAELLRQDRLQPLSQYPIVARAVDHIMAAPDACAPA